MPGINTTGKPNTNDYSLGRGIVYFGTLDAAGNVTEYRDVGNATEFKITVTTEKLQHKSSRQGLKLVDKEVIVSQELGVSLALDEINFDNLAFFLSGDAAQENNNAEAVAGIAGTDNLILLEKAKWYDLYRPTTGRPATDGSTQRLYDAGAITTVKSHDNMTTYTAGTDYVYDPIMGRIFIPSGSTMTANVDGSIKYNIIFAANATAKKTDRVRGLTTSGKAVAIKFLADNPTNSDQITEFQFHSVVLHADGDFSLIGDQFTIMTLKGVAGSNPTPDPNSPYVTVRTHSDAHQ